MTLSPEIRRKLVGCLGMLGSAHEGERAAAGLLATRLVRGGGLTWDQVIPPSLPPRPARDIEPEADVPTSWRTLARTCWFYRDQLTEWERGFISGLPGFRRISEKQRAVLERIAGKLRERGCAV